MRYLFAIGLRVVGVSVGCLACIKIEDDCLIFYDNG